MRQLKITQKITTRDTISLNKYMTEVSQIDSSGLTAEQEAEIAREIKTTKDPARQQFLLDKLTQSNLRFVISVAKQYQNYSPFHELNDLINAGNLGLIKAAHRFDETRGFKFISYAVWWIRQSILEEIANHSDVVRKPCNQTGMYNKVKKMNSKLEQVLSRTPTSEEITLAMAIEDERNKKLNPQDIEKIFITNSRAFRVDSYVNETESQMRFVDMMESEEHEEFNNAIKRTDQNYMLSKFLKTLHPNEEKVLRQHFGLDGKSKTLEEIGLEMDLTRERVRQIRERGLIKLRKKSSIGTLKEYL